MGPVFFPVESRCGHIVHGGQGQLHLRGDGDLQLLAQPKVQVQVLIGIGLQPVQMDVDVVHQPPVQGKAQLFAVSVIADRKPEIAVIHRELHENPILFCAFGEEHSRKRRPPPKGTVDKGAPACYSPNCKGTAPEKQGEKRGKK